MLQEAPRSRNDMFPLRRAPDMETTVRTDILPIPQWDKGRTAVQPTKSEKNYWAGAQTVVLTNDEDRFVMAYRDRQPVGKGRGGAIVIVDSIDGEHFNTKPLFTFTKDLVNTDEAKEKLDKKSLAIASLERAMLVQTPEGEWRLYFSWAEEGTKNWHISMMEGSAPDSFDVSRQKLVLAGNEEIAVKDPVVVYKDGQWIMYPTCHRTPYADPDNADRMYSGVSVSEDGIRWTDPVPALLEGASGHWDSRGRRITYFDPESGYGYYDGRKSAEQNWYEWMGEFRINGQGQYESVTKDEPIAKGPFEVESPNGTWFSHGALRYPWVVKLRDGRKRLYYEVTRLDGSNEIRTQLSPKAA